MKLIRHILSHSILIGFVALMVLGFYYRAVLFPVNWNEQISQQVDRFTGPYAAKLHAFAAPIEVVPNTSVAEKLATVLVKDIEIKDTEIKETEATVASTDTTQEVEEVATSDQTEPGATEENKSEDHASTEVAETKVAVTEPVQSDALLSDEASSELIVEDVPQVVPVKPVTEIAEADKEEVVTPVVSQVSEDKQAKTVEQTIASTDQKSSIETTASKPTVIVSGKIEETTSAVAMIETAKEKKSVTDKTVDAPVSQAPQVEERATAATDQEALTALSSQAINDSDEITAADSSEQLVIEADQLWLQARAAYGKGDMNQALQHYQALAEQDENNPDIFGELGNIHYAQGNFQAAGNAYYEAAIRLLEQGRTGQIHYLVRVIEGLSPANANKLKQRLMGR